MSVPGLLLETLEELGKDDFIAFKWHLSIKILANCKPIPKSRLEDIPRTETVSRMIESYGEKSAVDVTVAVLKTMNQNNAADELERRYAGAGAAGGAAATPSSSAAVPTAAPGAMVAQQGGIIIAPSVTGTTCKAVNITINK
ncbi:pyrin-like isoform X2 [Morone saxatilis]|uniref:pyrin-like isoform X2 n=1 Tax=Morone saxatilis TaxID=34816 RepID=UPI0015E1CD8C|nr:pyrin-like isoform X2 [Morone saxatilis]